MNFKPDKEWEGRGDIGLMSEIMTNSIKEQLASTPLFCSKADAVERLADIVEDLMRASRES